MKGLRNLLAVLFVFGVFYFPAATTTEVSAQAAQDFTLVNKTGVEIYALYVTPHNADDWGDDVLGIDTLEANRATDIVFSRREKAKLWDLRVEDEDGEFIEWENLNLLEISKVTLYYNKGKATAVVE
ncbi:MAG: hypothetical protein LH614_06450 [Pyrinomonadaceae bacterium]|nr:hypothetical protein [Pyrinomonadaceae bacterium]